MIGWRKGMTHLVLIFGLCLNAAYSRGVELSDAREEGRSAERGESVSPPNETTPALPSPSGGETPPNTSPPPSNRKEEARFWGVLSQGAILSEMKPAGKVIGSKDSKMMLGEGDTVYLLIDAGGAAPQKQYAVVRDVKKVYHPITGKYIGHLIQVVGTVKTLAVEGKQVTATVSRSSDYIEIGDTIVSMANLSAMTERSSAPPPSSRLEGTVVETKDDLVNNGQMNIVYIDRGEKDGVTAGAYFEIVHQDAEIGYGSDSNAPQRQTGKLIVLSTQDQTATAQIVESSEPITKGDLVFYLP